MIKRFAYITVVAFAAFAVSCSKALSGHLPDEAGTDVTFVVNIPLSASTKSGDLAEIAVGAETDIVYYEVWDKDRTRRLFPQGTGTLAYADVENNKAEINVTLVRNQTYTLVFWAQNKKCGAYDVSDLTHVKINYDVIAKKGNEDMFDAFYAVEPVTMDGKPIPPIYLHRPFAQLNFGATKMETDLGDIVVDSTYVTVSTLSTVFDTFNGVGDNGAVKTNVKFAALGRVSDTEGQLAETFNVGQNESDWIAMDYMLMLEDSDNVEVNAMFRVKGIGDVHHTISGVTLKKNHRTNIIGDLFTRDASLTVIVEPKFDPDDIIKDYDKDE